MRTKAAVFANLSGRPVTTLLTVLGVMLGISATTATSSAAPPTPASTAPVHAWVKHATPTAELGVPHPTGVAYSPTDRALLVTGSHTAAGTAVAATTTSGRRIASSSLPGALTAVTVDSTTERLLGLSDGALVEIDTAGAVSGKPTARYKVVNGALPPTSTALTFDAARQQLLALDAAARSVEVADVATDGTLRSAGQVSLAALPSGDVAGLAYNGADGLLYAAVPARQTLYAVDRTGAVRQTFDMSGVRVDSFQGMTFAPTADGTDSDTATSLYIADGGAGTQLGDIAEVYLTPQVITPALSTATLVKTTDTSAFNPPSPDPDGITPLPSGELLVADGEVDEIPSLFQNSNLWYITRAGTVTGTGFTTPGTPLASLKSEPTGLSYDPRTDHLFVSDDDQQKIYEIAKGADGKFGTTDDTFVSFSMSALFTKFGIGGIPDPEDVTIDTTNGNLYVIDGVGAEVYEVSKGLDGSFGGTDNNLAHFDIAALGATDPEGIYYYASTDTLFIVDHGSHKVYEVTTSGQLVDSVSIGAAGGTMEAGITVAPASAGTGMSFYVVDRRVDNNDVAWPPGENDGRLYEFATDLPGSGTPVPSVSAGSDQSVPLGATATLSATTTNVTGTVSTSWSQVSGPTGGVATFTTPTASTTGATFSAVGSYTLRVTATPTGGKALADDVVVHVVSPAQDFVANPGFETGGAGWNTNGSSPGVPPTQVTPGHTGSYAGAVTTSAGTCSLTDSPNAVTTTTTAGAYTASMWVRGATAGGKFQLQLREYAGSPQTLRGSMTAAATLSTGWQLVSATYTPVAPGTSTLDVYASVSSPAAGTCFIADDASVTVGAPGAKVTATPASVAFTQPGTAGAQTVTVTNTGTVPTAVTAAGPSGDQAADFSAQGCIGTLLAAGQSCAMTVTFNPTATGPRAAALTIVAGAVQTSVPLTGTGGAALGVATTALPTATASSPYSTTLAATGGTLPYTWKLGAGTLPAGLSLTSAGTIAGTPVQSGSFSFTVTVTDSSAPAQQASKSLTLTVTEVAPVPVVGYATLLPLPDFNGDGRTDIAVYRPDNGTWYLRGVANVQYGIAGDLPVPGNYVGDGRADIAVYRPSDGTWHVRGMASVRYGAPGDIPVPRDYNGDGRTDMAVFRPADGTWHIRNGATFQYGTTGDIPVPGDYTRHGRTDMAVYRPSDGTWHIRGGLTVQYGAPSDIPAPGDYNGDGRMDIAVFRPADGTWHLRGAATVQYGTSGDVPVSSDFNRDGRTEIAVFRPSNGCWYVRGAASVPYGRNGDIPV